MKLLKPPSRRCGPHICLPNDGKGPWRPRGRGWYPLNGKFLLLGLLNPSLTLSYFHLVDFLAMSFLSYFCYKPERVQCCIQSSFWKGQIRPLFSMLHLLLFLYTHVKFSRTFCLYRIFPISCCIEVSDLGWTANNIGNHLPASQKDINVKSKKDVSGTLFLCYLGVELNQPAR